MNKLLNFLDGKKTYIAACVNFVAWGLWGIKAIDERTRDAAVGIAASIAAYGFYSMVRRNLKGK